MAPLSDGLGTNNKLFPGAVEAILTLLSLQRGLVPPNLNLDSPIPTPDHLALAPATGASRLAGKRLALSNSFGFGGTNASLLFAVHPS